MQATQLMMQMGIERKRKISEELDQLNNKKILLVEILAHWRKKLYIMREKLYQSNAQN